MNRNNSNFHQNKNNKIRRNIKNSSKISFSAMMCALSCVILTLGSFIELLDMSMAALASFIIVVCMIELGGYMPHLVYSVTSVLSFLLLPNKTVVLIYVLFFGFYPIVKRYLEQIPRLLSWISKFAVFNILLSLYIHLAKVLFMFDIDTVKVYIVLLLNVIFFTLDMALTLFVVAYANRFRKLLRIDKFFK